MGLVRISSKRKNSALVLTLFLIGLVIFHFLGRNVLPRLMYTKHAQPVDFNHVFHGGDVGVTCDTCHFFYENGNWSGIPTLEVCAGCHSDVIGETAAEKKFVTEYVKKNKEVPWGLYFRQPQCVSFSHSSHVRRAKLACETCHGPQGLSNRPKRYMTNWITKYTYVVYDNNGSPNNSSGGNKNKDVWGTMTMNQCAECHRARGTSTACFICHK
ncbi:MAG: cytochrome c3 family protein [Candidatus Lindowbacteria bacterium]|nr:cytochrome c3 family protein [Candidatus Lindowbacteria bacterium]